MENLKIEKVLVLGASGYLGSAFVRAGSDWATVAVGRKDSLESFRSVNGVQTAVLQDFDKISLAALLDEHKPDAIVNFIGLARAESPEKNNFNNFYQVNCQITQNLLEAIISQDDYFPRLWLIGTAAEYGVTTDAEDCTYAETQREEPLSWYGLTKKMQTDIGLYYARVFKQPVNIVRPSSIIGPGMKKGMFLSDVVAQLKEDQTEINTGDLSSIRDFISLSDVVSSLKILVQQALSGEIINLGSGKGVTLRQLAEIVKDVYMKKFNREIAFREKRADVSFPATHNILDNTKLKSLGFVPSEDLEGIISDIFEQDFNNNQN